MSITTTALYMISTGEGTINLLMSMSPLERYTVCSDELYPPRPVYNCNWFIGVARVRACRCLHYSSLVTPITYSTAMICVVTHSAMTRTIVN